ncbi:hypothetical protein MASR1M107_01320 [Ignavibacteriales bacterium]
MAKKIQGKPTSGRSSSRQVPLWKSPSPFNIYFDTVNYLLLASGIVALIIGFVLLSQKPWDNPASLVTAPLVLVAAYVVILPVAILFRTKSKPAKEVNDNA